VNRSEYTVNVLRTRTHASQNRQVNALPNGTYVCFDQAVRLARGGEVAELVVSMITSWAP
jgi:hypothetical protein